MEREPSIHITKSMFLKLAGKAGLDVEEAQVDKLFKLSAQYALTKRMVLVGNNRKNRNKANKLQASSAIADANLLADVIYAIRVKMKHVGATKINQSSATWLTLKELAQRLNDYNNTFGYKTREGYIKFVEAGLKKYQEYRGRKPDIVRFLNNQYDAILADQTAIQEIKNDDSPDDTLRMYQLFTSIVLDKTGLSNTYRDNPEEYIHFLYARQLADHMGVDYETFLEAQFDALAFFGGIPQLRDLHSEKAQERLLKYASRNGINFNPRSPRNQQIDWGAFKR